MLFSVANFTQMSDHFCPFIHVLGNKKSEVLCARALLWDNWVSHFLVSPQILITGILLPWGLFSFSRGKFFTVLPSGEMPGCQVSCHL